MLTLERLFASVKAHMRLQVTKLSGSIRAVLALERFLTSVHAHVRFHLARIRSSIGAVLTLERLLTSVHAHVRFHIARIRSSMGAVLTLERLLAGVRAHVDFQPTRCRRSIRAVLTLERLLASVHASMILVVTQSRSTIRALTTRVQPHAVNNHATHCWQIDQRDIRRNTACTATETPSASKLCKLKSTNYTRTCWHAFRHWLLSLAVVTSHTIGRNRITTRQWTLRVFAAQVNDL